jgi:hypothetical protein
MISDSQANLKNCFTTGAEAFSVQTAATVIIRFIYFTSFVAELFSYVNTEAKFNLLLGSGNLFLPNVARVWLQDRAGTTRR